MDISNKNEPIPVVIPTNTESIPFAIPVEAPNVVEPVINIRSEDLPVVVDLMDINYNTNFPDEAMLLSLVIAHVQDKVPQKVLESMNISNLKRSLVYIVKMKSFFEYRSINNEYRPNQGEIDEFSDECTKVDKWDIKCCPPGNYVNKTISKPIPKSEELVVCSHCTSSGKSPCRNCNGNGIKITSIELPSGKEDVITNKCVRCDGTGHLACSRCLGYCKLIMYRTIRIHFRSVFTDTLSSSTLKESMLKRAEAKTVYSVYGRSLLVPTQCKSPLLKETVDRAWMEHETQIKSVCDDFLFHHQSLEVIMIPVTTAVVNTKKGSFGVNSYGLSHRIDIPDLPDFSSGCSIL